MGGDQLQLHTDLHTCDCTIYYSYYAIFGILSMRARVRVIITGKLLWHHFFGNKILESE